MAYDAEKTEDVYQLLRHFNGVTMTALTLGFAQRRAHGIVCLYKLFFSPVFSDRRK